jgi:glycosyltransferase involved in cell wall biosynthesis
MLERTFGKIAFAFSQIAEPPTRGTGPGRGGLRLAHMGTFPPRRCGIATYTHDVVSAVHACTPTAAPVVIAMCETEDNLSYGYPVQYRIAQHDPDAYVRVAQNLNATDIDLVSIQHEHGIFGGPAGITLNRFLETLEKPVVATLHTVLPKPSADEVEAIRTLSARAERLVVLNSRAVPLLRTAYGIATDHVTVIPHGTPEVNLARRPLIRTRYGLSRQRVVSTFGLLSPGKGLEHAIEAVARIAHQHPDLHYYILGQTHPGVIRDSGETYRESLEALAEKWGITDRIHFVNRYLTLDEVLDWLLATDVYVTPYLNANQITSGTLAYAVAAGKAVLSTPYLHAQELLTEGRGLLTPFADPQVMADKLDWLLGRDDAREAMAARAFAFGQTSSWPVVARRYAEVFTSSLRRTAPPVADRTRAATQGRTIHAAAH